MESTSKSGVSCDLAGWMLSALGFRHQLLELIPGKTGITQVDDVGIA